MCVYDLKKEQRLEKLFVFKIQNIPSNKTKNGSFPSRP